MTSPTRQVERPRTDDFASAYHRQAEAYMDSLESRIAELGCERDEWRTRYAAVNSSLLDAENVLAQTYNHYSLDDNAKQRADLAESKLAARERLLERADGLFAIFSQGGVSSINAWRKDCLAALATAREKEGA